MISLVLASALALFRATLSSQDPLLPQTILTTGPHPVDGLWAALPTACGAPTTLDLALWPACAVPIGFLGGELAPLQKPEPGAATGRSYVALARTHYVVEAGSPDIVEVEVPIMFSRSTVYIALKPDALGATQSFTAATGWPVGCPAAPLEGVSRRGARCIATSAAGVRAAAAASAEAATPYRLVRIAEAVDQPLGAPPSAGSAASEPGAADGAPPSSPVPPPGAPPAGSSQTGSSASGPGPVPPPASASAAMTPPASEQAPEPEMTPPAADPTAPPATLPTAPPAPMEEAPLTAPGDAPSPPPGVRGF